MSGVIPIPTLSLMALTSSFAKVAEHVDVGLRSGPYVLPGQTQDQE